MLKRATVNRKHEEPYQGYHRDCEQGEYCASSVPRRSRHYWTRKVAVLLSKSVDGSPGYFITKVTVLFVLTRT